jgi:O-antigen/teichoic acid export membrane protein
MLKGLGKDVIVYGASDFVFKMVAFAVFPIYAYRFSVYDFGVIELVTVFSILLAMLGGLGLNNAVQRFYWEPGISRDKQRSLVTSGFLLQTGFSAVLVTAILAVLYPFRNNLEANYGISWAVAILALGGIIPAMAMQFVLDVLRLHLAPWRYTSVAFLRNILGVMIGLVLIFVYGFGISGIFIGTAVAGIVAVPLGLWMIGRDIKVRFDRETAGDLLQFGYPFVFTGIANWIFGSLDRWMLAQLSSVEDVGLYGIAFKFTMVVMFMNAAFGQAWSPWAMKLRSEYRDYRRWYSRILLHWFLLLTIVGCFLSVFAKELLAITSPPAYWPAANILVVAVLGVVFLGTTQITAVGISIERQTRIFAFTAWIGAVANFVLNLLLIPVLGALGAATATTLTHLGLSGAYLYWTQRLHPLPLQWGQLTIVFLAGVLVVPIALILNTYDSGTPIIIIKLLVPVCLMTAMWRLGLFRDPSVHLTRALAGVPDLK